jgi:hypothetical protein
VRVVERLDTEAVACGEQRLVGLVPEDEGELTTQPVQALRAELLVEMDGDLAGTSRN